MKALIPIVIVIFLLQSFTVEAQISYLEDSVGRVDMPVPSDQMNTYNWVYNNGATDLTIRWRKIVNSYPASWTDGTSVCDKNLCWGPTVDFEDVMVPAGDSTNIDVYFYNGGRAGEGRVEVAVFDLADSAGTVQTAIFTAKASPVSSIRDVNEALSFYPNPVLNEMIVKGIENANAEVMVYNVLGKLVKQTILNNGVVSMNDVAEGFYMINVIDDQKVYSNTFFKK